MLVTGLYTHCITICSLLHASCLCGGDVPSLSLGVEPLSSHMRWGAVSGGVFCLFWIVSPLSLVHGPGFIPTPPGATGEKEPYVTYFRVSTSTQHIVGDKNNIIFRAKRYR